MNKRNAFPLAGLMLALSPTLHAAEPGWLRQAPSDFHHAAMEGPLGEAAERAVMRLGKPPFTLGWLRADISFEQKRQFTNFSGDVSGRFLEVASLTSPVGKMGPETLPEMLKTVSDYQKPDGHFGVDVNWQDASTVMKEGTPVLWGNARMLVGLVTAYEVFKDPKMLSAARKLGDFYVNTADVLCDPAREKDFRTAKNYFSGFDVCYYPVIESLARLYLVTQDKRYLQVAERMAARFIPWDKLPLTHTHGNLCVQYGRLLLYEITGKTEYLAPVEKRWEEMCKEGYVWPNGGVGEKFTPKSDRDEGCAEADWLRLNLRLWADTGKARYLDAADRLIHNEYLANQFPSGGFGHRKLECDAAGLDALLKPHQEATWCCVFHGALGYVYLKSYLATGDAEGVRLNFPLDFSAVVKASGSDWRLTCKVAENKPAEPLVCKVSVQPTSAKAATRLLVRVPDWAAAVEAFSADGKAMALQASGDHVVSTPLLAGATELKLVFKKNLIVEDRRLQPVPVPTGSFTVLQDVVLRDGPDLLYASVPTGRPTLIATVDAGGKLHLPVDEAGHFLAPSLTEVPKTAQNLADLRAKATTLPLESWGTLPVSDRKVFIFNVVVVPQ